MIGSMGGRLTSPFMVGRWEQLAALDAALETTIAGRPRHVIVGGEAGVGKSRFIAEVTRRAEDRGVRVLAGECVDLGEGGLPLGPLAEAFRNLARSVDQDELVRLAGPGADDLGRIVPALGAAGAGTRDSEREWVAVRASEAILGFF